MRRGFTLLEVLIASIILGAGLAGILVSFAQAKRMMLSLPELETAQEVMDLGEMAYPLDQITDEADIDQSEQTVDDLWQIIAGPHGPRMTREQEEKYDNFTWEREVIDKNVNDEELKRLGNLFRVRITVKWGRGENQQETYVTLWRKPES